MVKLGIVGVTGLVGNKILEILKEENLAQDVELFLMASEKSCNKKVFYYGKIFDIFELNEKCLDFGLDYVIFSAGDEISKVWAKRFVEKRTVVIDNTNAFRKNEEVPLIVPEINADKLSNETMLISNPNCSTIQLAVVVDVLMKMSKVKKIVVSTYQSVSGAGRKALNDFKFDTGDYFPVNIHENIIAEIGSVDEDGFCTEERKIMFELNKILDSKFEVVATAVRVPVLYTHGESVYVEF
ncbi:MAG: aspartate-semialdehyde dehydrogenase, partial [Clostridia bacterium]|nr:aspartate-semialdehyde dehydrogenase [Clostridia bacterium]